MTIRTVKDSNDMERNLRNKLRYEERKKNRLEAAGIDRFTVSFVTVEIRSYPMILGNNPAVSQGPPLEIGWKHLKDCIELWPFDKYEETRPKRRSYAEMNLPVELRFKILEESGFPYKEIVQRSKEVKKDRINRLETTQTLYRRKTHERIEKFNRGLINIFSNKKQREKDLMEKTKELGQLPDEDVTFEYISP